MRALYRDGFVKVTMTKSPFGRYTEITAWLPGKPGATADLIVMTHLFDKSEPRAAVCGLRFENLATSRSTDGRCEQCQTAALDELHGQAQQQEGLRAQRLATFFDALHVRALDDDVLRTAGVLPVDTAKPPLVELAESTLAKVRA